MNDTEFETLVNQAKLHEVRHLDFKVPAGWRSSSKRYKLQVARAILGMSNLGDISYVVIGVDEDASNRPVFTGMSTVQIGEWVMEEVQRYVANYGDPSPVFVMEQVEYSDKQFLILSVDEFEQIPVIAASDGNDEQGNTVIRDGTVYVRKHGEAETIGIPSQTEMRELLDLATRKGLSALLNTVSEAGGTIVPRDQRRGSGNPVERFDAEIEDLL